MPRATGMTTAAPVQAVERTMRTLELLADTPAGLTVLELADSLQVDKSIASRLLGSLATQGYVVRDADTQRYELSLKLPALASRYADAVGFPAACEPVLQDLASKTRELIQLSAVEQGELVLVAVSRSRHALAIMPPRLGTNIALHATASGKAWLASLDDEQAARVALRHDLRPLTAHSITTVQGLLSELAAIRKRGYATAEGEYVEGVNAIACGVGNERFGKTVGVVALSAPATRLGPDDFAEHAERLREAATQLESVWSVDAVRLTRPGPD